MRTFLILISLTLGVSAKAPECPIYKNKKECLASVEENYKNFIDLINQDFKDGSEEEPLILAAADIKHFETLACEKTCLN